ncbi:hypothetical protein LPW11_06690 [Geomonas sp. RF6]|uniref:hypothetical protein n=1 Tax=Geomonas sp. RF6 TaxID=2897342 RepID=UPI001E3AD301|nr:hypothetical protein [Geomonas sp. RF6]UFS71875.1 hypothetical protein LPW11_06690 [Geomonas sp. RF6]
MVVVLKQILRSKGNGWIAGLCALGMAVALAGCGGGGGSSSVNAVAPTAAERAADAFSFTTDEYGMQGATYLAATTSSGGVALRAAIASSISDPAFRTVTRIDVAAPGAIAPGTVYALGSASAGVPSFPGNIFFFDGHQSTLLQTAEGSIRFTSFGSSAGDTIAGTFSATIVDGYDSTRPSYRLAGDFSFTVGASGPVLPAAPPIPALATQSYEAGCASCHTLGSYDMTGGEAPDLALKGGKLPSLFGADATHHGMRLASAQIGALKILLNAN